MGVHPASFTLVLLGFWAPTTSAQEQQYGTELSIVQIDPSDISIDDNFRVFTNKRVFIVSKESSVFLEKDKNKLNELFPVKSDVAVTEDMSSQLTHDAKSVFNPAAIIVVDRLDTEIARGGDPIKDPAPNQIPRDPILWGGSDPVPLPAPQNQKILMGGVTLSKEQSNLLLGMIGTPGESIPLLTVNESQ